MKHLTTLLAMAITLTGLAQQMPYNPDANGDDFVGVDDVLGVLGVYDTALMQPDLQCDYEGTEFEQFIIGALEGSLILDSVYVEYNLIDSSEVFTNGCPDPIIVETVLNRSYMLPFYFLHNDPSENNWSLGCQTSYLGYEREFYLTYNFDTGRYHLFVKDIEVDQLTQLDYKSRWYSFGSQIALPFPEEWEIDSDGIQIEWDQYGWLSHCESFRVIPFWHEAE